MSIGTALRPGRRAGAFFTLGQPGFAKLWAASAVSNVGDGVTIAAGPLLVASLTADPGLVAGAVFIQQLPWLLFSLIGGAYVDRLDRRRVIVVVNVLRAAVIGGLTVSIWWGAVSIAVVYAAFFCLGVGEMLADNAVTAMLPAVVAADKLPRANARLMAVQMVGNHLASPPFGAWLFVVGAALPFGFNAATFLGAAALIALVRYRQDPPDPTGEQPERRSLRTDITEGVRWLWHQRTVRMLAVCLCVMNVTLVAAFAVLVLYARQRLGLGPVGYGVLLAASAIGGLVATGVVGRLETWLGPATLLRVGLVIETTTHLVFALTRSEWVAGVTMAVFGAHAAIWGVVAMSQRQRLVPARLLGRVTSVYQLFSIGGVAVGALVGGFLARTLGITAPFWISFAAMTALTVVAWRRFTPSAFASTAGAGSHP